jgi:hypothetical protein
MIEDCRLASALSLLDDDVIADEERTGSGQRVELRCGSPDVSDRVGDLGDLAAGAGCWSRTGQG